MISLQPQEQFTIVRQLPDHTDSTTYYVRAVVRNSLTDAIIPINGLNYVNLTDKGSRRFAKTIQVPPDVSGLGLFIDILTAVYTDSNYTTRSDHGDELEQYLVFDRFKNHGGGGGSTDVDYKKIDKMLDRVIKAIPKASELNLEPVLSGLQEIKAEIKAIDIPEPEKLDNTPVIAAIKQSQEVIVKAIDDKEVTEVPDITTTLERVLEHEQDLSPIINKIEEVGEKMTGFINETEVREGNRAKFLKHMKKLTEVVNPMLEDMPLQEELPPVPERPAPGERAKNLL